MLIFGKYDKTDGCNILYTIYWRLMIIRIEVRVINMYKLGRISIPGEVM